MTLSAAIIVTLVLLVAFNILAGIWCYYELWGKLKCEHSESDFCPSYACVQKDDKCGIKPYRTENGTKTCQVYLTEKTTQKKTPPS